jgi:hypothetical protein
MAHVKLCFNHVLFDGYLEDLRRELAKVVFGKTMMLGDVLLTNHQLTQLASLYHLILEGYQKTLETNYPDSPSTIYSMTSVFNSQGKHNDAPGWYQRALADCEKH